MKELEEAKKLIGEIPIKDIGSINILILSKAIEKINEYQECVKNLALPQVSKCEGIKREPLLIDFMDWLKDQPSETGLMDSEEVVSKYLEGN